MKAIPFRLRLLPALATLGLAACMSDTTQVSSPAETPTQVGAGLDIQGLIAAGLAKEAPPAVRIDERSAPAALPKSAAATEYINFQDPVALSRLPSNGYVRHPGYKQDVGGVLMTVWMSQGPHQGLAPAPSRDYLEDFNSTVPTDTFSYEINWTYKCIRADGTAGVRAYRGSCGSIPTSTDRWHEAQQGDTWLAIVGHKGRLRHNFGFHRITVRGTEPVTVWAKVGSGYIYWSRLAPGTYNLPAAENASEVLIRSASGLHNATYSVDNIQVSVP